MALTRRQAIQLLTALPAVSHIAVAQVQPTDVIVVECEGQVSFEMAERIRLHVGQVFPDRQVLVLGGDVRLRIARLDEAKPIIDAVNLRDAVRQRGTRAGGG